MAHGLNQAACRAYNLKMFPILDLSSFQLYFRTGLKCYIEFKKKDYLCNCKSEKAMSAKWWKQFLYYLGNIKDLRLSILWPFI